MAKLHKSKLNMLTTLMKQLIATLCGILLPRVLIGGCCGTTPDDIRGIAELRKALLK